jgi:hemoglobin
VPFTKEVIILQSVSASMTRRNALAVLTTATSVALWTADNADAQPKPATPEKTEKSLYDRLGGVFAIAAVVDHFSDALVKNPIVGQQSKNSQLREWHTRNLEKAPRPQVHAHAVGMRCFGRADGVHGHQA